MITQRRAGKRKTPFLCVNKQRDKKLLRHVSAGAAFFTSIVEADNSAPQCGSSGIGGRLFGSANDYTRAQIAAFLWRTYSK